MSNPTEMSALRHHWLLRPVTDTVRWNNFVRESSQGSIFSSWEYLQALNQPFTCMEVVGNDQRMVAGIAVIEDGNRMHAAPFPFTPYQGILFSRYLNDSPCHKRTTACQRITEFIVAELIERYGNIEMALSPAFEDIRPFSWHNHGQPALPQCRISTRYTARLSLADFTLERYLTTIRSARRQEFQKSQAVISETQDIGIFLDLYVRTFQRQQLDISGAALARVKRIAETALGRGFGYLTVAHVDGIPASCNLFIFDNTVAYYLFGANDPAFRASGASTRLMISNIKHFAAQGFEWIDFVGVNSPQRGDFKLSFNPALVPYFEIHLDEARTN